MRFTIPFFGFLILAMTSQAFAGGPWDVKFRDEKLPSQSVLDSDHKLIPLLGTATAIKSAAAISSTGGPTVISTFTAQPDVTRNILLTPTGTTSNVAAGTAVVSGLNILGHPITENFSITSTQSTATTGAKGFKSITSVSFPQAGGTGVTLSIGTGTKLGLKRCLDDAGKYVFSEFGGVYDTTRGTVAVNATAVESNTFISNSALDGVHNVDVYFVQNFRCF